MTIAYRIVPQVDPNGYVYSLEKVVGVFVSREQAHAAMLEAVAAANAQAAEPAPVAPPVEAFDDAGQPVA